MFGGATSRRCDFYASRKVRHRSLKGASHVTILVIRTSGTNFFHSVVGFYQGGLRGGADETLILWSFFPRGLRESGCWVGDQALPKTKKIVPRRARRGTIVSWFMKGWNSGQTTLILGGTHFVAILGASRTIVKTIENRWKPLWKPLVKRVITMITGLFLLIQKTPPGVLL